MSPYDDLMATYVTELRRARDEATAWWDGLIRSAGADPEVAHAAVRSRWPAGPSSYPGVIAVYRAHYLACEALNDELRGRQEAEPSAGWGEDDDNSVGVISAPQLLLDGLEPIDADLAAFMSGLVFAPIGTDPNGDLA